VPHEIDKSNIIRLQRLIYSYKLKPVLFSELQISVTIHNNEILIIDAMGVLANLYREADIVFIGGSFKGSVHSVLEPAVFGKPIITGPFIRNSREAIELERIGGLIACNNKLQLTSAILNLSSNPKYRNSVSETAFKYFMDNLGATERIINDIKNFL
jgi:3-deoxy-D-manno-octulosonic-acid transferase